MSRKPDLSKRYVIDDGSTRTLAQILELCSGQVQADDPALALWSCGARPEDGRNDPAIEHDEF